MDTNFGEALLLCPERCSRIVDYLKTSLRHIPKPQTKEIIMARYVDGFGIPVPKKKLAAYFRIAAKASKIWK